MGRKRMLAEHDLPSLSVLDARTLVPPDAASRPTESARVQITPKTVTILLEEEGDINLELWAGERVADLFQQIYGRDLALQLAS